jgi:hypothetical protein
VRGTFVWTGRERDVCEDGALRGTFVRTGR